MKLHQVSIKGPLLQAMSGVWACLLGNHLRSHLRTGIIQQLIKVFLDFFMANFTPEFMAYISNLNYANSPL